jgi:hypothetical protein
MPCLHLSLASHSGWHIHFKYPHLVSQVFLLALSGVSKPLSSIPSCSLANWFSLVCSSDTSVSNRASRLSAPHLPASIPGYTPESSFDPSSQFLIFCTKSQLYVTSYLTFSYCYFTYPTAPSFFHFPLTYPKPQSRDNSILQHAVGYPMLCRSLQQIHTMVCILGFHCSTASPVPC